MKAFKITETGNFMTKLLSGRTFDSFLLEEASLSIKTTWILDGKINRNFYSSEEWEDETNHPFPLISWGEVRGHMRELIRGKKAPASLSIVLELRPDMMEQLLADDHGAGGADDFQAAYAPRRPPFNRDEVAHLSEHDAGAPCRVHGGNRRLHALAETRLLLNRPLFHHSC